MDGPGVDVVALQDEVSPPVDLPVAAGDQGGRGRPGNRARGVEHRRAVDLVEVARAVEGQPREVLGICCAAVEGDVHAPAAVSPRLRVGHGERVGGPEGVEDRLGGVEGAARGGPRVEVEPHGEGRGGHRRRLGVARVDVAERGGGRRISLHAVVVDVDEEAVAVDVEGAGPRVVLGPLVVPDDEEPPAVDGQVQRARRGLEGALAELGGHVGHRDALPDLHDARGAAGEALAQHVGEVGLAGLEAHRVRVGDVVADDVHLLGAGVEPRNGDPKCASHLNVLLVSPVRRPVSIRVDLLHGDDIAVGDLAAPHAEGDRAVAVVHPRHLALDQGVGADGPAGPIGGDHLVGAGAGKRARRAPRQGVQALLLVPEGQGVDELAGGVVDADHPFRGIARKLVAQRDGAAGGLDRIAPGQDLLADQAHRLRTAQRLLLPGERAELGVDVLELLKTRKLG